MAEKIPKLFIDPYSLQRDSVALARKVYDDGYHPNRIIGLWRGGAPIGLYVHEALEVLGVRADYIPIITRGYERGKGGVDKPLSQVAVQGTDSLAGATRKKDKVLVVDDVWDSGRSIDAFLGMFEKVTGERFPDNVRVATVYYKPIKNKSVRVPNYYVHEAGVWLVFPHEFSGRTRRELKTYFSHDIADLLKK